MLQRGGAFVASNMHTKDECWAQKLEKRNNAMQRANQRKFGAASDAPAVSDPSQSGLPSPVVEEVRVLGLILGRGLGYKKDIGSVLDKAKVRLAVLGRLAG